MLINKNANQRGQTYAEYKRLPSPIGKKTPVAHANTNLNKQNEEKGILHPS